MNELKKLTLLFTFLFCSREIACGQDFKNYDFFLGTIHYSQKDSDLIVLRKFTRNRQLYYFTVNPRDLSTSLLPATGLKITQETWQSIREAFRYTPYIQTLIYAEQSDTTLQNAGIITTHTQEKGAVLTIDLCPSTKPLNRLLFNDILSIFSYNGSYIPVVVTLSGKWISKHKADMRWLTQINRRNMLTIDWVNHTTNHRVAKYFPAVQNQKMQEPLNEKAEIYQNEVLILQWGITPSVFFRFPGLLSDSISFHRVINSGLIPIGSNAWLAKNQNPLNGSIILVHGNGNEENGIAELLDFFKKEKEDIKTKNWLLLDLKKSLKYTFIS